MDPHEDAVVKQMLHFSGSHFSKKKLNKIKKTKLQLMIRGRVAEKKKHKHFHFYTNQHRAGELDPKAIILDMLHLISNVNCVIISST